MGGSRYALCEGYSTDKKGARCAGYSTDKKGARYAGYSTGKKDCGIWPTSKRGRLMLVE